MFFDCEFFVAETLLNERCDILCTHKKFPIFAIFRLPSQKQEGGEIYILTEKTQCHEPFKRFLHTFYIFFSPTSVGMAICVIRCYFSHKPKMSVCGPYRGCCRGTQKHFLFKPSQMPKECVRKDKFLRENQFSDTYWSSPKRRQSCQYCQSAPFPSLALAISQKVPKMFRSLIFDFS